MSRVAERALRRAADCGAQQAAVRVERTRFDELRFDGKDAFRHRRGEGRELNLGVLCDQRYAAATTTAVAERDTGSFVERVVASSRELMPDPCRGLPRRQLCGVAPAGGLQLWDPTCVGPPVSEQRALAVAIAGAARAESEAVRGVNVTLSHSASELIQLHSDGFRGTSRHTVCRLEVEVTVRGPRDTRPHDLLQRTARHRADLPAPELVGRQAARTALRWTGEGSPARGEQPLVVDRAAAAVLVRSLVAVLSGRAAGGMVARVGDAIASPSLTIDDDPLVVRGVGSRVFDEEGLRPRSRRLIDAGRLRELLLDCESARRLGRSPTAASPSNVIVAPGPRSPDELCALAGDGVLVDRVMPVDDDGQRVVLLFRGRQLTGGEPTEVCAPTRLALRHDELWHQLRAVGDDPQHCSAWRVPSLLFGPQRLG